MKYDSFNNLVKKIEDNKTTYYINKEYEYTYDTDIKTLNVLQEFKHNLFSGNSEDLRGYTSHKQLYSFNLIDMGW